jgi:hypothetical protein
MYDESDDSEAHEALRDLDADQLIDVLAFAVTLLCARQSLRVPDDSVPVFRRH